MGEEDAYEEKSKSLVLIVDRRRKVPDQKGSEERNWATGTGRLKRSSPGRIWSVVSDQRRTLRSPPPPSPEEQPREETNPGKKAPVWERNTQVHVKKCNQSNKGHEF